MNEPETTFKKMAWGAGFGYASVSIHDDETVTVEASNLEPGLEEWTSVERMQQHAVYDGYKFTRKPKQLDGGVVSFQLTPDNA